ncbi:carbonic anhydrase [Methylobacterium haplocladii]|uniref:Carbonic anhydrase n=1 Tax=Methylobacterium haplocladii TaxID=1176176 RepID=A0A512IKH2_9HYPH|nr:carbonic anhydrase [Methylobacterium haplocladii]GEO98217.1 carbonic anhydrase [Methylobacterium haplocladii]GJD84388.1 Carbonic anhydrase 2 [Methylobacterium haplocladii]GLS59999.1 carbonic anhydrase [Methylobacterium haplocladii]
MTRPLTRRHFLGCGCAVGMACFAATSVPSPAFAATLSHKKTDMTPDQALQALKDGNQSFSTDSPVRAVQGRERRIEIALGQTPFCVLVSCSDSRVSPEILFGRGLGELFIVRNAGNTVDTAALGSIEYAISQLGVPLILVMGHGRCGAVLAAVDVVKNNTVYPGAIGRMIEPIIPAVLSIKDKPGDLVENAVRANVSRIVSRLRTASEPALIDPLENKALRVVGASYSLDTGGVDFFDEA